MDLSVIHHGVDASKLHIRQITIFFARQAHLRIMYMCQIQRIFLNTFTHYTSTNTYHTSCGPSLRKCRTLMTDSCIFHFGNIKKSQLF